MEEVQARLRSFTPKESSFVLDLELLDGRTRAWVDVDSDDKNDITRSHWSEILEDLIGKTATYELDADSFVIGITAEPPDIVPQERPPPPVRRCRLCSIPFTSADTVTVALVADDGDGSFRFVVHPGCDPGDDPVDEDRELIGVF
jgi:hypothetical protein